MSNTDEVPVLFRNDGGDIVAVFPTIPHDNAGNLMTCYAHIGQHSGCTREWLNKTRPATMAEYANLFSELRQIGYQMRVVKRVSRAMNDARFEDASI